MAHDSNTPLRIAEVASPGNGLIGITLAPGKKQPDARHGPQLRDLGTDLDVVAAWNAAAVVALVTADELKALQIAGLPGEVSRRFMEWHHLPIEDYGVPDEKFEAEWPDASTGLRQVLACGGRVLFHCKGGLGRAGMVSARLLVETGTAPADAIAKVRAARPGAIETRQQEDWVAEGRSIPAAAPARDEAAIRDRALGALVGLAVGDAVGTTLEFSRKPAFAVLDDMVGGGPFNLQPGQWTDDTAMALALAESLLAHPDLDPGDLMRRFVDWQENGTYSCTGVCFDIGTTIGGALDRFRDTGNPLAGSLRVEQSGNGALMRLSPVAVRHWRDRAKLRAVAETQTRVTHASPLTIDASLIFAELLADAIEGKALPDIVGSPAARRIKGGVRGLPREAIRGSGFVNHTLQAAVWAVARTTNFRAAVLLAANLGEDADTTAAVAGQLAGAVYGLSGIPTQWRARLAWGERIEATAAKLFSAGRRE